MPNVLPATVFDTGPSLELQRLGTFEARAYGAKGDGTTDDLAALQAAANDAGTSGRAGVVLLPPGTYLISAPLTLPNNVTLQGCGIDVTTIQLKAGTFANFGFQYMVQPGGTSCQVFDLTIDGNRRSGGGVANQGGGIAPGDHWRICRVRFFDINYFKLFINAKTGVRVWFCRFEASGGSNDNIGGGSTNKDVQVFGCYWKSDSTGNCIDFAGGSGYVIQNNHSEVNNWYFEGVVESYIAGNKLYGGGGLTLQDSSGYSPATLETPRGNTVIGNKIVGGGSLVLRYADYAGASVRNKGGGNVVSGNSIITANKWGILVHGVASPVLKDTGDVITGNIVVNCNTDNTVFTNTGIETVYNSGIALALGKNDVVQGNVLIDNRGGSAKMPWGVSLAGSLAAGGVDTALIQDNAGYGWTSSPVFVAFGLSAVPNTKIRNSGAVNVTGSVITGAAAVTPGASPWTYTAGPCPEVLHLRAGTVSLVVKNGVTLYVATPCAVPLEPYEAVTVTYTVVPTAISDKK